MSNVIGYICNSIMRSENAIDRLNRNVLKLARCNNKLGASTICLSVAGILLTVVVASQDLDIKALKKQVAELEEKIEREGV